MHHSRSPPPAVSGAVFTANGRRTERSAYGTVGVVKMRRHAQQTKNEETARRTKDNSTAVFQKTPTTQEKRHSFLLSYFVTYIDDGRNLGQALHW